MPYNGAPALTKEKWLTTTVGIASIFPASESLSNHSGTSWVSGNLLIVS